MSEQQAEAGKLPRIGELVEKETGVKYDSYNGAQKALGLEAAMAAIASNPDYRSADGKNMAHVVDEQLLKQADLRMKAVETDMGKLLAGDTLTGLKDSSFLMVKMAEHAPAGLEATLERAREGVKDSQWLRAEGASNVTNFARDVLTTVSSATPEARAHMTDKQKYALEDGVQAAKMISDALIQGKPMNEATKLAQLHRLDKAMDTAVELNPGIKETPGYKQNYEHYREAMRSGIDNGVEAVNQQVQHAAKQALGTLIPAEGVTPAGNAPLFAAGAGKAEGPMNHYNKKIMVAEQENFKERISSLGKQSALWAVAAVGAAVGGVALAWNTLPPIAIPIGLAVAAYSGFKSVQKLWQRHKLHREATSIADDVTHGVSPSLQQHVDMQPAPSQEQEVASDYWRNTVRVNQTMTGRSA